MSIVNEIPSLAFGHGTLQSVGSNDFDIKPSYNNSSYQTETQDDYVDDVIGPDVPFSLVQRGPPLLVGDGKGSGGGGGGGGMVVAATPRYVERELDGRLPSSSEVVEVLHTLLPPITLNDANGRVWKQYCSTPMSNRDDVYQLQHALDAELIERQARPYGICPVRELLYSQSFDELLRQVALESPERGLMLLRVRDQLRMSIACYQTLFHNSTTFGTRRAILAETGLAPYQAAVDELLNKKKRLQSQVYDLKDKLKVVEEYETEESEQQRKQQYVEKTFLEEQISQLRSFLRTTGALVEEEGGSGSNKSSGNSKSSKKSIDSSKGGSETRSAAAT